jgi:Zn-dependent protease
MKGYTQVKFLKIFGAPVQVHWSALVVMAALFVFSVKTPLLAIVTICSYFGFILLHEAGHAYFARRMGCRPLDIHLGLIHGRCTYEAPYNLRDDCIIAWGGVAAQIVVAIPLIVLHQTTPLDQMPLTGPVVTFLGYISVIMALFNLMPVMNLDGVKALQLIHIEIKHRRNKAVAKKITQDVIRRLKKR